MFMYKSYEWVHIALKRFKSQVNNRYCGLARVFRVSLLSMQEITFYQTLFLHCNFNSKTNHVQLPLTNIHTQFFVEISRLKLPTTFWSL